MSHLMRALVVLAIILMFTPAVATEMPDRPPSRLYTAGGDHQLPLSDGRWIALLLAPEPFPDDSIGGGLIWIDPVTHFATDVLSVALLVQFVSVSLDSNPDRLRNTFPDPLDPDLPYVLLAGSGFQNVTPYFPPLQAQGC